MTKITVKGEVDDRAVEQLKRCVENDDAPYAALLPDGHVGYSMPIGGVVGYRNYVSPSGVGYDIGCGNKAVFTSLHYQDVREDLPRIMDEIVDRISFGVGRVNNEPLDHPILDRINHATHKDIRAMLPKARKQLGTVGAGNHYVDLFREVDTDRLVIGVHFGSRGFGHGIASGFLALAQGKRFTDRATEGEMDAPPTLLHVDSALGYMYVEAMTLAGDFAHAGRDVVCDKVLEILGGESIREVHNHHNYAWLEEHGGERLWVVRKGCTPAFPGQEGFVGSTMGEPSVILRGRAAPPDGHTFRDIRAELRREEDQRSLLFSTVHGAGRVMSRTKAAGRMGARAECADRNCDFFVPFKQYRHEREIRGVREDERFTLCPAHPDGRMQKRRGRVADGLIDYSEVRSSLRGLGIELRGGAADEAPAAYKRLYEVLSYVDNTVEVTSRLVPVGVAMAGANTFDPWKD
jgi:tRNA-splicing ligase RtcB